tara:strand:+ start:674 stop:850 length:177 start_codon:yes stop_codon:yes gene_type:complete
MDYLLARVDQLESDKKKLIKENKLLKKQIQDYDQSIVQRIIDGKNLKLQEYKDKNLQR